MEVLVTGVTGAVGSALAPRLAAAGHNVRGLTRRAATTLPAGIAALRGDAVTGAGLDRALRGVDVAYFLIHSMEAAAGSLFAAREQQAAANFACAARVAGVRRVIYLGGPAPQAGSLSPHLASRLGVEATLVEAAPETIAFRAAIMIGPSSRSFRFLVRLVERMPVLPMPAWRTHRTAPIDERDLIEFLVRAAITPGIGRESLDIAGPELVSYQQLIERIRDHMLISRPTLGLGPLTLTPIVSRVAAAIAGEDPDFIGPMMLSLDTDLLPRDDRAAELFAVRRHSLDAAIEHALAAWERDEPLAAR